MFILNYIGSAMLLVLIAEIIVSTWTNRQKVTKQALYGRMVLIVLLYIGLLRT